MTTLALLENDLDRCLHAHRDARTLALVMYLTAGYPDAASTVRWGPLLAESGAAIVELGVPFSDPLGDGPTIQRSSQRALAAGMTMRGSLDIAASIHVQHVRTHRDDELLQSHHAHGPAGVRQSRRERWRIGCHRARFAG